MRRSGCWGTAGRAWATARHGRRRCPTKFPPDLAERLEYAGVPVIPEYALNRQLETAAIDTPEALSFASQRRLALLAGAHALLTGAVAGDADAARVSLRLALAGEPVVLARIE